MKKQFMLIVVLISMIFSNTSVYAKKYSTRTRSSKRSFSTSSSKNSSLSKYNSTSNSNKTFFSSGLSGKKTLKETSTTSKSSYDEYNKKTSAGKTYTKTSDNGENERTSYYRGLNYNPPRYYYRSPRRFGMWDSLFLWMMLDNIMTPSYSRFYYNHRYDPDIVRFMKQAEEESRENDELREKLDKMEEEIGRLKAGGEEIDPSYLPEGIDENYIYAATLKKPREGSKIKLLIKTSLLLSLLFLGGMFLKGSMKKKNKKKVGKDASIPSNLEVGSYIEFDDLLFSNISYDSKFLLNNYKNTVKSVGVSEGSIYKTVNIYLDNEGDENLCLQLSMEDNRIKRAILLKNYDNIYPKTREEWELWLGSEYNCGLIGDDIFKIEDEIQERVQDLLYKFSKRMDGEFSNYRGVFVETQGDIFSTNLFEVMSRGDAENYQKLCSQVMTDTHLNRVILGSKKEDKHTVFKLDLNKIQNECGVEYSSVSEGIVEKNEECGSKHRKRRGSIYSRYIQGEFFTEEFLSVESVADEDRAYISIDIGVEIPVGMLEKL